MLYVLSCAFSALPVCACTSLFIIYTSWMCTCTYLMILSLPPSPSCPPPPPPSSIFSSSCCCCLCLQMISAERLMAYGQLQPEAPLETPPEVKRPPKAWPLSGAIRMHKLRFRYATETPYVLKDVSVEIKAGEKVSEPGRHSSASLSSTSIFRISNICLDSCMTHCSP